MGNPYTEVTISGYNANPPDNDGSSAATNLLDWDNHTGKIGGPLKTGIESTQTNLTAAFAKLPFIDVTAITATHTQVVGDRGKLYSCTNSPTIDLLAAATAGSGFTFGVYNAGSGTVTLDGNGSETVNGTTTVTLEPGAGAIVTTDGSVWTAIIGVQTTASSTELNLLDGVTSTTAEINELDESAAAVAGYQSGIRQYVYQDAPHTSPFNIASVIGATFESVGPTSSGATNTWTELDNVPSGAQAVVVRFNLFIQGATATNNYSITINARETGGAATVAQYNEVALCSFTNQSGSAESTETVVEVTLPIDSSGRFDLAYAATGASPTLTAYMYLCGFIA